MCEHGIRAGDVHCTEYYTILYIDDSEAKSGSNKRDTETALGESPRRELVRVYCIVPTGYYPEEGTTQINRIEHESRYGKVMTQRWAQ